MPWIRLSRSICQLQKDPGGLPIVDGDEGDGSGRVDGLLWYKDLGNHLYGEFSMVVVQAHSSSKDRGELESRPLSSNHLGPQGTFIGVYDGHDGSEAS
ncbi:hypothetical protein JHK87_046650 [Glycine soja]|nr:hypothetical protein JHK87_046650 [Glycine soja]